MSILFSKKYFFVYFDDFRYVIYDKMYKMTTASALDDVNIM